MTTLLEAIAGVSNACQALPHLVTGGQPETQHLDALRAAGTVTVLDVRDPMEPRPIDEPRELERRGMRYLNIPVVSGALTDEVLEEILAVLRDNGDAPLFFHCASGNRVGGALIPYFIVDLGMSEEEAVDQAMRIGLRSPELLEWGLTYARRSQDSA